MNNPVITIGEKKIEMKKLTVGDWSEMADIYDKVQATTQSSVEFIRLHCKMLEIAFGLTQEEINNLPAEDIVPIYVDITVALKDILTVKLQDEEKKRFTETLI